MGSARAHEPRVSGNTRAWECTLYSVWPWDERGQILVTRAWQDNGKWGGEVRLLLREGATRAVAARLAGQTPLSAERVAGILSRVKVFQERVGYPGDCRAWIDRVRLPRI